MVNNTPTSVPYGPNSSGWGGGSGGVPNASCTGSIAASFTWQPAYPSEPPPSQVIVTETCTASASVAIPQQTGQYNTGLGTGSAPTGSVTCVPGGSHNSISGTSVRYTAQTGGQTAVLQAVNPSATAGGQGSSCSVGYTASVSPVIITLSGTLKNNNGNPVLDSSGNQQILIGQSCGAGLSGIPSSCTVSNYQWSVSGTTFQSWTANNSKTTEVDGLGPTTNSTASWFWDDLKTAPDTITCTATVTPPSGQGSPFTVTATQKVTVYVPGWTCKGTAGTMQINTLWGGGNGTDSCLYAGTASGSGGGVGMDWNAILSPLPAPFSGTGALELVQTETPNSTYTSTTGAKYKRSNNGQQGLDTSYPYPWVQSPSPYETNDSPGIDLTALSAASGQLQYQFVDCLMFEPPGGSQFVPLATYSWSTPASSTASLSPAGTTPFTASNTFPS